MPDSYPLDKTFNFLGKSLEISARRHSLITGNIANLDTINYKPKDLDFQKTLKKAVDERGGNLLRTHPRHLRRKEDAVNMKGAIRTDISGKYELESVDIDTEMTNLMENNVKYRTSVEMLLRKISILREAITGGGR